MFTARAKSHTRWTATGMTAGRVAVGWISGAVVCFGATAAPAGGSPASTEPWQRVDPTQVMESLRSLPTSRAALGDHAHQQGLRKTERLLADRLREFGYEPEIQKIEWASPAMRLGDTGGDDSGSRVDAAASNQPEFWNNLIVDIPGREIPREVLLIGAHFDAVPRTPGADDNGTGTAALLEIARVLRDVPMKRTVRLVFFNLEEIGLVGSRHYAAWHARERGVTRADDGRAERIVGMVSLEMLGYYCDTEGCQKSPIGPIEGVYTPPTRGDTLAVVTTAAVRPLSEKFTAGFERGSEGLKITRFDFLPVPIPDILRSDHAPFLTAGIPAIMLTDTSNFRNPHYHTPTDTVETIDPARYVKAVRGVVSAIVSIAEPSAVAGSSAGDAQAASANRADTQDAVTARTANVVMVLNDWHAAAAAADFDRYFGHMTDGAVFIGTDDTERWTVAEFKAYAKPYFDQGKGWTYLPIERHVTFNASGEIAWFDEKLDNSKYGRCRGSGVLVPVDGTWKIEQYVLSFPVPNDLAGDVVAIIKDHQKKTQSK
jgi:ketosteroid isomerase-like protein